MKHFDFSISDNPLHTREEFQESLLQLLAPLEDRYVSGGLYLGNAGAHYSPRVALMEGWSRLLWGIAPLLSGGGSYAAFDRHMEILKAGIDEEDEGYWGEPPSRDQRLVEMTVIAFSLMIAPERFWEPLSSSERERLYRWLSTIERRELPANNWHFFRILVCAAFRSLGLPVDESAERASFDMIESCYRGDGWYVDGSNDEYDLYNPFGFHFYGLVYAKLAGERDVERTAAYRERARLFAPQFLGYFREDGSMVPHGRSLTYRFAAVSFFSACAFADLEALPWPVMKGVFLRHLRWWFSQPILDAAGLLSVGYAYPNLIMAEQYNAPGSPYWALKTYLVLALGEEHPFWRAEEAPLPALPAVSSLPVPAYLINRSAEDVQLLCPGRYPGYEVVQAAAKYCKFAYSARFGFSVSHGAWCLEKTGCDSSLVLSEGDGYWRERRHTSGQSCRDNWTAGTWKPWEDVEIRSFLVAMGSWHVRIHRIESGRRLEAVEGGFSLPRYRDLESACAPMIHFGAGTEKAAASIVLPWGASRIVDLSLHTTRVGEIIILEPNLNILYPSALVPVLRGAVPPGRSILCCAVRAGDGETTLSEIPPSVLLSEDGSILVFAQDGSVAAQLPVQEASL